MAKISWDQIGERYFQTGCDHGVLYPQKDGGYPKGVPWNGLTNVTLSPSGAEDNAFYADNMKYLNLKSAEEMGATITCYFYPPEWAECNGEADLAAGVHLGQQRRNTFGFSYRSKIGNDTEGEDHGFVIHLLYGCSSAPSEQSFASINESPEATELSYEITTTPVPVSGKGPDGKPFKPVAHIAVFSTETTSEKIAALEEILYGSDASSAADGEESTGTEPRLPLPDELKQIFAEG